MDYRKKDRILLDLLGRGIDSARTSLDSDLRRLVADLRAVHEAVERGDARVSGDVASAVLLLARVQQTAVRLADWSRFQELIEEDA